MRLGGTDHHCDCVALSMAHGGETAALAVTLSISRRSQFGSSILRSRHWPHSTPISISTMLSQRCLRLKRMVNHRHNTISDSKIVTLADRKRQEKVRSKRRLRCIEFSRRLG